MKNITARVRLSTGEFVLSLDPQSHLIWKSVSGETLPVPESGSIRLWDGCVDVQGEFHLFVHTESRYLIHCHTADGQHWQKQSLSRLDREDVHLQDLRAAVLPELTLVYLLSGAGRATVAVRYTQNAQGSWQGRRLELPLPDSAAQLVALFPSPQGSMLYTVHPTENRNRIFCTNLTDLIHKEVCSTPALIILPQLLRSQSGQLHTVFVSRGEVFGDGCPLGADTDFACLYEENGRIYCSFRNSNGWKQFIHTSSGWEKATDLPFSEPCLEISVGTHQLRPHWPALPQSKSAHAVFSQGLTQTLHNQAILLSSLQESFRELQQQHFALSAQVKALDAQQKSQFALRDRCLRLEQAMEALEALLQQ